MKRQDAVVRALPTVVTEVPEAKCLFVGPCDGDTRLHNLASECRVDARVVFAGPVPHEALEQYYNLCDLFVLPSKSESFGIVYLEALACGKPVIGGKGTGAEDALLDGRLGLLADPDDVPGLADAIIRMLKGDVEPHLLDPQYLRETVLAHYGFERFTERVGELLQTMLEGDL